MKGFRALKASEVECRIGVVKEGRGVSLLLYKDARCDMNILDETVGPSNWQREHELIDDQLFCSVGIWDEKKDMWVYKQDVGVESRTEAEKGRASDAFKRACFNWGIGRELYTAPFIWIGGATKNDRFYVDQMEVEDHVITSLLIKDSKGTPAFSWPKEPKPDFTMTDKMIRVLEKTLETKDVNVEKLLAQYKVESLGDLTEGQYTDILRRLKETDEQQKQG